MKLKTYEQHVNKNVVYLLTSDGHRDSVNLQKCAIDENGLKKLLMEEYSDLGHYIVEDSIQIDFEKNEITYEWYDMDEDDINEGGKCKFFTLNII